MQGDSDPLTGCNLWNCVFSPFSDSIPGPQWLWFFAQEDHHEYDLSAPAFPGGLQNSGHKHSLLTLGVANEVGEWFQQKVAPVLVVGACKKTKLVRGHNLLIEDYTDQSVQNDRESGLGRVQAAVKKALTLSNQENLERLSQLLVEANTNFIFKKRIKIFGPAMEKLNEQILGFLDPLEAE